MTVYLVKLAILLPMIGLLAWGAMKLATHMQKRLGRDPATRSVRIVETTMLSPGLRLAVLSFHGREILVSVSRHGMTRLAEAAAPDPQPVACPPAAQREPAA